MNWYEILFLKYLKGLPSKARMFLKLAKGGTMQLLPVNDDEPETSPFKGVIRYPDTSSDVEEEFTYKQSSYTGQARIKSIKGNTLVWNQLVNGMVTSSADGITTAYNSSTNVITITNNSRTTNYGTGSTRGNIKTITITSGHKYLFCIDNVVTGVIVTHDTGSGLNDIPFNSVYTATTDAGNFRLRVTKDYDFVTAHPINSVVSIKIMCIDLTILNDSHITDYNSFKTYFPLSYYAYGQYLLNFNVSGIKTTGKNLLDVSSGIAGGGGVLPTYADGVLKFTAMTSGTAQTWVMNFPLYETKAYTLSFDAYASEDGTMILFDGQPDALYNSAGSSALGFDKQIDISTTNTRYTYSGNLLNGTTQLRFYRTNTQSKATTSTVYISNVQLEFGSSASTYEPYTTSTTTLPISTYFPTGMKSAGSVYDELSDKAITRVGSVDLGSLTWANPSNGGGSSATWTQSDTITSAKPQTDTSAKGNIVCFSYETASGNVVWEGSYDNAICISQNSRLQIRSSAFLGKTGAEIKTLLSGVYLNYELATYTEQDVDPEDTQILLNRALSTVLGRNVSVDNPQEALNILTKGE